MITMEDVYRDLDNVRARRVVPVYFYDSPAPCLDYGPAAPMCDNCAGSHDAHNFTMHDAYLQSDGTILLTAVCSVACHWALAWSWTWKENIPIPQPEKTSPRILQRVGAIAAALMVAIGIRL